MGTERQEAFIAQMEPINGGLLRHPFLTALVLIGLMAIVVGNSANEAIDRSEAAGWVTWAVVALVVFAAVSTVAFNRITNVRPDQILVNLIAFAFVPLVVAWSAMVGIGTPTWLSYAGFIVSAILVVVVIWMAKRSEPTALEAS